jgi:hypothetical protein
VTGVQALDGLKLASKLMRGGRKQRQANEQAQQQAAVGGGTNDNDNRKQKKISRPKRMSRVSTANFNSGAL